MTILPSLLVFVWLAAAPDLARDTAALLQQTRTLTLAGRWGEALAALESAQAGGAGGDARAQAVIATERGRVLADRSFFHREDPEPAREALKEAARLARAARDEATAADAAQYLGQLEYAEAFETKDWKGPRSAFEKVIAVREKLGDRRGLAVSLFYLGLTYEQDGLPGPARENYEKSLALAEELGDLVQQSYARRHLAGVQEEKGELAAARQNIDREIDLRRRAGFAVGVPFALLQKADFVAAHGSADVAAQGRADVAAQGRADVAAQGRAGGAAHGGAQGGGEAARLLEEAITAAERCGSTRALALAALELSRWTMDSDPRLARALAVKAHEAARSYGASSTIQDAEQQVLAVDRKLADAPGPSH